MFLRRPTGSIKANAAKIIKHVPFYETKIPKRSPPRIYCVPGGKHLAAVSLVDGKAGASDIHIAGTALGGGKVAFIEVMRPTNGLDGRSSIGATEKLLTDNDAVSHLALNPDTFKSIVSEFEGAGWKRGKPRKTSKPLDLNILLASI